MAKASPMHRLLGFLRGLPVLYRFLRAMRRGITGAFIAFLRAAIPRSVPYGPPKGTFSAIALLRNREIPGRIVLEQQESPVFGPDTLVKKSNLSQDLHQPWPVFWTLHRDARLVGPSLVHLNAGKEACFEAMYGAPYFRDDPSYNYCTHTIPMRLDGNWTSIVHRWGEIRGTGYWHFILDSLPRLALLGEFPADTRILTPPNLETWQRQFLDFLGLAGRYRETNEPHLLVENYHFSSLTSMTGCCNPYAVDFLRKSFLPKADASYEGPRKFYILRRGWTRGVTNEDEVQALFKKKGWELISPENLSIPAQMQLFKQARAVCGLHGSALTNLLWASPGCRVLELCPSNFLAGAFEWLARILDLPHAFLVCKSDSHYRAIVDFNALEAKLDTMD